jgi:hypothetical protein
MASAAVISALRLRSRLVRAARWWASTTEEPLHRCVALFVIPVLAAQGSEQLGEQQYGGGAGSFVFAVDAPEEQQVGEHVADLSRGWERV